MSRHSCRIVGAVGALGLMLLASAAPVLAQTPARALPTESEIADKLLSPVRGIGTTRCPSSTVSRCDATPSINDPKPAEEKTFINSLRSRSVREITLVEREKIDEIAKTKPKIDLDITFDFNSAVVSAQAQPLLRALGGALSRDDLKGTVFWISDHTDGKGGDQYNQDLSERRAEAVKRLLVKEFNLSESTLIAVGFGRSKPKNTADPLAAENRRVQIVNTELK